MGSSNCLYMDRTCSRYYDHSILGVCSWIFWTTAGKTTFWYNWWWWLFCCDVSWNELETIRKNIWYWRTIICCCRPIGLNNVFWTERDKIYKKITCKKNLINYQKEKRKEKRSLYYRHWNYSILICYSYNSSRLSI